jgi:hypothetical protein
VDLLVIECESAPERAEEAPPRPLAPLLLAPPLRPLLLDPLLPDPLREDEDLDEELRAP